MDPEPGWEQAHYPIPKCLGGTETIWLTWEHHQVQGLLQSEESQHCCFHNGDVKRFLTRGFFVAGWFELWDLYDKWSGSTGRNFPAEVRRENGKKAMNNMPVGVRRENGKRSMGEMPIGIRKENGKKTGKENVKKMHVHPNTIKARENNGREATNQRWRCLVTRYESNPGALSAYQKARGIDTSLRERVG